MHIRYDGTITKSSDKPPKSSEKTPKSSEKNSEMLIRLIKNDAHITIKALANQLGLTTRAIEKSIARLKAANRLERIGSNKGGQWKVVENT